MSKIFLQSSTKFLVDHPQLHFDQPLEQMQMLYVTTASKGVENKAYIERAAKIFADNGYRYESYDIENKSVQELRQKLAKFDVLYMQGGNTFYLLKAIRGSSFEQAIRERLAEGMIYIGVSAGAYVACPSIEQSTWKHPDKYDRCGVTDFTGMALVPFLVSVHYDPQYEAAVRDGIATSAYPVRILTDEQALKVEDGTVTFLGPKEIVLN